MRIKTETEGKFLHDRFVFYICIKGEGLINEMHVRQGETILVSDHMGWLKINGKLDLFLASYRNQHI